MGVGCEGRPKIVKKVGKSLAFKALISMMRVGEAIHPLARWAKRGELKNRERDTDEKILCGECGIGGCSVGD